MISNLAYIHPDAKIGATVEPFAYIAGDVVIGDDCWIGPGAVIHDGARIGNRCRIHTAASVSCLPQDLKFAGEITTCEIGDDNDIREYVTISRGTASTGTTRIGSNNLLMAYTHVGHDCICWDRTSRPTSSCATTRCASRASTRSDFRAAASRPSASPRSTTPAASSSRAA